MNSHLPPPAQAFSPAPVRRVPFSAFFGVYAFACGCGTDVQAAIVSLHPSLDNSIFSESDNSNALGPLFAGETPTNFARRALLEFDIAGSGIPTGSAINSVTLSLTLTRIGPAPSGQVFELHPLLAAWGAGTSNGTGAGGAPTQNDATWYYNLYRDSSWANPGGDYGATTGTTTIGSSVGATYTFFSQPGLVANVRNWLASPGSNFGWILRSADETPGVYTAREFGSSESLLAQQPTLTVTYTPIPEPGTVGLLAAVAIAASTLRHRCRVGRTVR